MAARRAKARPGKRRPNRPRRARVPLRRGASLAEPPHGHIVCRQCGRIHPLDLGGRDQAVLIDLSTRATRGWTVERIAYSLAALCPNCAAATRA